MQQLSEAEHQRVASAGLSIEKVAQLLQRAGQEVREGLLPAAQIAMAHQGEVLFQRSFGTATDTSLTCIFSATKAITSAAAWLLLQEGKLSEAERVGDIVEGFLDNGKEAVTVEQLFTHTAGFPSAPFAPADWDDRSARYARFRRWHLNWPPGDRFEYHPSSSMWVVADIIEQRSGMGFREFVRERIIQPLGLGHLFVGLPESEQHRALACEHVGESLGPEDYRRLGMPVPPKTEVTEEAILSFNRPEIRAVGSPGGGGFANAPSLALFHQALLHGGLQGTQLWEATTLANAKRIRSGQLTDPVYKKLANRALGLIISGDDSRSFRGFGKTNSPAAFGHNGAGGQLAWTDPASGLSLVYLTPGHDRNSIRQGRRGVAISSLAGECMA